MANRITTHITKIQQIYRIGQEVKKARYERNVTKYADFRVIKGNLQTLQQTRLHNGTIIAHLTQLHNHNSKEDRQINNIQSEKEYTPGFGALGCCSGISSSFYASGTLSRGPVEPMLRLVWPLPCLPVDGGTSATFLAFLISCLRFRGLVSTGVKFAYSPNAEADGTE